ncbi:MAG: aldolase/citrate lyase family protein [Prosthecobacter sp.]|nr:aldolase/citrate lyase family protein [Prosthecobacter sp.]
MNAPSSRIGTWLSLGSSIVAELAALSGFDWVLFDLEHGSETEATLPNQLRALRGSRTQGIVRVGAPHPELIARVLDWGANGIMVPHVNTVAEAEAVVQAAHYAPRGHRGLSRTVRACDYGLGPSGHGAPLPKILAQIETIQALNHAAEIAAVDGIDVLFVGPADLQFDLTNRPGEAPGDFTFCLKSVVQAAQAAGKTAGILLRDSADLQAHLDLGFTDVAIESDITIIRKGYQQILANRNR